MLIQTAGLNILLDPVWSKRVSPFRFVGPKRVNDPGIAFADLPSIDVVLVSHGHSIMVPSYRTFIGRSPTQNNSGLPIGI